MAEAGGGKQTPSFRNTVIGKNKEPKVSFTRLTTYNTSHSSKLIKFVEVGKQPNKISENDKASGTVSKEASTSQEGSKIRPDQPQVKSPQGTISKTNKNYKPKAKKILVLEIQDPFCANWRPFKVP